MRFTEGQRIFFADIFGFDLDLVKIETVNLGKMDGLYVPNRPGIIFIDKGVTLSPVGAIAVTHEICHVLQNEYGQSISLDININTFNFKDKWNHALCEIDATISTAYYIWYLNHEDEPRTKDTVKYYIKRTLQMSDDNYLELYKACIKDIKVEDKEFIDILKSVF